MDDLEWMANTLVVVESDRKQMELGKDGADFSFHHIGR